MDLFIKRLKKLLRLLPPLLLRDIRERYAGSIMGVFWTFLQPMFFILLYWLIFSQILKVRIHAETGDNIPFIVFLLSGILPWFALQEGVLRGASSIIEKRHIIKKVIFPAELFPIASVISAIIHHGIGIIIFLSVFFIWKGGVSLLQISLIITILSVQMVLTVGLSFIFSALTVYVRDIIQILGTVFQAIFYISTILYPLTFVPKKLKVFILSNPVTSLAEAYHNVILYGRFPALGSTAYLLIVTVVVFFTGIYLFRKLKMGFADVL